MKIKDLVIPRKSAESIENAYYNHFPTTIKWGNGKRKFILEPRYPFCSCGRTNGRLVVDNITIEFKNIKDIELSFKGSVGKLTIEYDGQTFTIQVIWYKYELTDLHPRLSHWHGIYKDECGNLYCVHEWGDWFDDDEFDDMETIPDGAVYWEVFEPETSINAIENGEVDCIDGGVIGYTIGDRLKDVISDMINGELKKVA